jgi:predicted  nucleic acid-binding Zn-ribbon protein
MTTRAKCSECGSFFSPRRLALGYRTCLECGEQSIQVVNEQRKKQCAPAYNKGAYQFITDMQMVRDLGR